jgi:hypothetical protein
VLEARSHPHGRPSAILVDDVAPDPRLGAGFPRAAALVRTLIDLGWELTIYATAGGASSAERRRFPDVEVVTGGPSGLRAFFESRVRAGQVVIVSRPHNMQYVKAAVGADLTALAAPCVYDAEAIYAHREIGRRRLAGERSSDDDEHRLIEEEVRLTRGAAAVLAVSDVDHRAFVACGVPNVFLVGHAVDARPTPNPPDRRRSILFVGAFHPLSPNEDAVRFLCREILPALEGTAAAGAPVAVVGAHLPGRSDAVLRPSPRLRRADALCGGHPPENRRGGGARRARGVHPARRPTAGMDGRIRADDRGRRRGLRSRDRPSLPG